jgi:hypothetical protein
VRAAVSRSPRLEANAVRVVASLAHARRRLSQATAAGSCRGASRWLAILGLSATTSAQRKRACQASEVPRRARTRFLRLRGLRGSLVNWKQYGNTSSMTSSRSL